MNRSSIGSVVHQKLSGSLPTFRRSTALLTRYWLPSRASTSPCWDLQVHKISCKFYFFGIYNGIVEYHRRTSLAEHYLHTRCGHSPTITCVTAQSVADEVLLYSDVDVWFRRPVTMSSMGLSKLPTFYTLGPESSGAGGTIGRGLKVGNQGVMFLRLESMRATYWAFVESTFSPRHLADGLHFQGYGPADQGAYNKVTRRGGTADRTRRT